MASEVYDTEYTIFTGSGALQVFDASEYAVLVLDNEFRKFIVL